MSLLKGLTCCTASIVILLWGLLAWVRPPAASSNNFAWAVDPFGATCKRACLLGIQPGITSLEEAATLLRMHPLTDHLVHSTQTTFYSDDLYVTLDMNEKNIVTFVSVSFREETVRLGDLITGMGTPDAVELALVMHGQHYNGGFVSWIYDESLFATGLMATERQFSPQQPVEYLELHTQPTLIPTPVMMHSRPMSIYLTPDWLGFGSIQKYLDHPKCSVIVFGLASEDICPGW